MADILSMEGIGFFKRPILNLPYGYPSGESRSDGSAGIAGSFIDTDYNEESFFTQVLSHRGQSHQPSQRRGHEGVSGGVKRPSGG